MAISGRTSSQISTIKPPAATGTANLFVESSRGDTSTSAHDSSDTGDDRISKAIEMLQ